MFYVYILKSDKDKELYTGSTNDLKRRLKEHNAGKVVSTKTRKPFQLVYYEAFRDESEARRREKVIKTRGQARVQLIKRIDDSINFPQTDC